MKTKLVLSAGKGTLTVPIVKLTRLFGRWAAVVDTKPSATLARELDKLGARLCSCADSKGKILTWIEL